MKALPALVLLAGLAGAWLWGRHAIDTLRAQNQALHARSEEAERLAGETRDLEPRAVATASRTGSAELLRLRNEIRQLRALQQETEKLRAANQRVAAEIQSGQFKPRRLAEMEGAVPRAQWALGKFTTPELAIQSFLSALANGDHEQALRCLPPHQEQHMRHRMNTEPGFIQEFMMGGSQSFGRLTALRIVGLRMEEEKAVVEVQLSTDGKPIPFVLYREDNQEWKLSL